MAKVPAGVRKEARLGLALRARGFQGATKTGWDRGKQLANNRTVDAHTVKVMKAWFARHKKASKIGYDRALRDGWLREALRKRDPEDGAELAAEMVTAKSQWRGAVAWLLWGGNAAEKWLKTIKTDKKTSLRGGKKLCSRGIAAAKKRYKKWPSAYASGHASQVCSGKIRGLDGLKKASPGFGKRRSKRGSNLSRWYKEKWVDACTIGRKGGPKACGRQKGSKRSYPYCRPTYRVSPKTPVTWKEMSAEDIRRTCAKKRRSPRKVMKKARSKRRSRKR